MIIKSLKSIGQYLGVHATTILRWHRMYPDDFGLCFPLMVQMSGKGQGFLYVTSVYLIAQWIQRHSDRDIHFKRAGLKYPRQRKMLTMGAIRRKAILNKIIGDVSRE